MNVPGQLFVDQKTPSVCLSLFSVPESKYTQTTQCGHTLQPRLSLLSTNRPSGREDSRAPGDPQESQSLHGDLEQLQESPRWRFHTQITVSSHRHTFSFKHFKWCKIVTFGRLRNASRSFLILPFYNHCGKPNHSSERYVLIPRTCECYFIWHRLCRCN